jgi:hypothetical protein
LKEEISQRQKRDLEAQHRELRAERVARGQDQADIATLQGKLEDEKSQGVAAQHGATRASRALRITVAVVFWLFAMTALALATAYVQWLNHHSKRLGIIAAAMLIATGIAWAIADRNKGRRNIAIGAVVIGALVSLTQILDSDSHPGDNSSKQTQGQPPESKILRP